MVEHMNDFGIPADLCEPEKSVWRSQVNEKWYTAPMRKPRKPFWGLHLNHPGGLATESHSEGQSLVRVPEYAPGGEALRMALRIKIILRTKRGPVAGEGYGAMG